MKYQKNIYQAHPYAEEFSEWIFENGIRVSEEDFDYSLHCFQVWNGDKYLGSVYPSTIEDMHELIKQLDDGSEPTTDSWEDGCGNTCSIDGWGDGLEEEEQ